MSESYRTAPLDAPIMECLSSGEKRNHEIYEAVEGSVSSIKKRLSVLTKYKKISKKGRGRYALLEPPIEVQDAPAAPKNSRGESENTETINKMLNLYDKLLDTVSVSIEGEDWKGIVEKIETIKSLRWLGATVDQLMKRWYLVHRGYDTNTRQAVEDAKHKTVEREKQDLENAPPADQRTEVGHFHSDLKTVWDALPESEKKSKTV